MYNDIWYQAFLFVVFLILGVACAFIYDAFRISERFARSGIFLSFFKDILFWLVITVLMFVICLKFNNGVIRLYMFIGIFAGAFAYFYTISKYVLKTLFFIINLLKKIVFIVFKFILLPFKFILKLFNKPLFLAFSFTKKSMINIGKKIKFKLKVLKKFKR